MHDLHQSLRDRLTAEIVVIAVRRTCALKFAQANSIAELALLRLENPLAFQRHVAPRLQSEVSYAQFQAVR